MDYDLVHPALNQAYLVLLVLVFHALDAFLMTHYFNFCPALILVDATQAKQT